MKEQETIKWLNEKTKIVLTRKEMFRLANMLASACQNDYSFTESRDRKVRKIFAESIRENHNLWLKIVNSAEGIK